VYGGATKLTQHPVPAAAAPKQSVATWAWRTRCRCRSQTRSSRREASSCPARSAMCSRPLHPKLPCLGWTSWLLLSEWRQVKSMVGCYF
ncbi:hypothetical protein HaLaN_05320, partial [Haematococcus lacustris]